ncbi:PDT-domain-containing protein [Auriscalpium vulgare]|uniref:PDT-domain-containing protein n=1 Tax=Auriscalpium vulgare TaxID=40419 RepID=A0ACB8S675_9AGAM|nr:PDT-domain-containing protein [Auriscalpium vulgare]
MVVLARNGTAAELPKLAFLGPVGTYSHQAAHDAFSSMVEYHVRQTIADVFHSVDAALPLGLLPQENSIFGTVTETYDLLRSPEVGKTKFIRGAVTLSVRHCLLVRKGTRLEDIKTILSHEQALGQCRSFIEKHLPGAALVKMASTAAAAETVSRNSAADAAAICSKICAGLFSDLDILHEGIQNENDNFTRFYVMSNSPVAPLPVPLSEDCVGHGLIRIEVVRPPANSRPSVTCSPIMQLLEALQLPVSRIDRRPSTQPGRFESVYLVEVIDDDTACDMSSESDEVDWARRIQNAARRVREAGGLASILGTW